jgi:uncharacterized protein with HEPN domain
MLKDDARLLDMLAAAHRVTEYAAGRTIEEFRQNGMLQDAIIRQRMIVGEAARAVSEAGRNAHPLIAWRQMRPRGTSSSTSTLAWTSRPSGTS